MKEGPREMRTGRGYLWGSVASELGLGGGGGFGAHWDTRKV